MKKKIDNRIKNRVAVYSRYSSDNQREESITAQERAIEKLCKDKGYIIVEKYSDAAVSGKSVDKREDFARMIEDAEKGLFDICVVHKLNRFSRSLKDAFRFKTILNDNGVRLESVTEPINDTTMGVVFEAIFFGMAEAFSKELATETLKGLKENCYKGMNTGGKPALGYNVDKETKLFTINEDEAVIIRMIFKMYDEGFTYQQIIDKLNQYGFKTRRKKSFQKTSLGTILTNTKYIGTFTYNRCESKKSNGSRNNHADKSEEDILRVEGVIPPIIDKDVWDRVQVRLNNGRGESGHKNAKAHYLLSNLIVCSCGKNMVGNNYLNKSSGERCSAYRCENPDCNNGQIKAEWVDSFVLSELERIIFNENQIVFLLDKIKELQKSFEGEAVDHTKEITNQIRGIDTKINNLLTALEDGIKDDFVFERLSTLREEKQLLQKQLLQKESSRPVAQEIINEETIYSLFAQCKEYIRSNNIPACRSFIKTYVNKVIISGDDIDVELLVPFTQPQNMQQWLRMRTSITLETLKKSCRTSKSLRLVDNKKAPIHSMAEITANSVLKTMQG